MLTGLLAQDDASRQAELIRILAARNAVSSVPLSKKRRKRRTDGPQGSVEGAGQPGEGSDTAALLELLVRVRDETGTMPRGRGSRAGRPDRPDLRAVLQKLETVETPAARGSLIRLVSAVGDDSALPALRKAVQSGDAGVRDAAIRGLAAWPTPAPFEDLVNLARTAPEPVHRVLALRAAIRLSSKAEGRTPEQMTGLVTELMQLAGATAERKGRAGRVGAVSDAGRAAPGAEVPGRSRTGDRGGRGRDPDRLRPARHAPGPGAGGSAAIAGRQPGRGRRRPGLQSAERHPQARQPGPRRHGHQPRRLGLGRRLRRRPGGDRRGSQHVLG